MGGRTWEEECNEGEGREREKGEGKKVKGGRSGGRGKEEYGEREMEGG